MDRFWRNDARLALLLVGVLHLADAAWAIQRRDDADVATQIPSTLGWLVLVLGLLWWTWSRRSVVARWVLLALVAVPLLLLLLATDPVHDPGLFVLIASGVAELVLLLSPAVRQHVTHRVALDTY